MLPPEIWKKILYHAFIGQESPDTDTLDNCRQVCRDWNVMIKRSVWQKPNKEWGVITKSMIEKNWSLVPGCLPSDKMISHVKGLEMEGVFASGVLKSLAEGVKERLELKYSSSSYLPVITCAASLAHHGLLRSVEMMRLYDVDLTSVPADHLASLFSSVTDCINIENVSGFGLVTILDSVKSMRLFIKDLNLDSDETRALVRAMESRVEVVGLLERATLDTALMEYSGQGKCRMVVCYDDTATTYREELRAWATSRNWSVVNKRENVFYIQRI